MTLSQMCSLSETSCALYLASVVRIAILPHSEHSLRATRSLASVGPSMMNKDELGLAEGGGEEERPGDEGGEGGSDKAASWMSPRAATALATT